MVVELEVSLRKWHPALDFSVYINDLREERRRNWQSGEVEVISAIILAAGRSERFGGDKRLALIDQTPMLLLTALKFKRLVPDTLVVLGSADTEHERFLNESAIDTTRCPNSHLGMGHSLAHGIAQRPHSSGWLVMPADMPFIQADTVQRVLEAARDHVVAAPVYRGRRGHPVWFEQRFGEALRALSGDEGAKSILLARDNVHLVTVDDPGCTLDIDCPQDLASALA